MRPEEYRRVTDVTYHGVVHGTLAALHRMLPRDRGTIVQVGLALAQRGIPLQSAYCAAKHAVDGFMDSLRAEMIHDRSRVHVTRVNLPAVNTPQFQWVKSRLPRKARPVPPIFQPEVAAEAIHWAAHHRRRELWVGASTAAVIVGNRLMSGLGDRYLGRRGTSRNRPVSLRIRIVATISGIPSTANTAIVVHMARSTSGRFLAAVSSGPPPIVR